MYDVFGLGNALVDTEVNIDDGFLHTHRIAKGHMTLVDTEQMHALAEAVSELPTNSCSGGSAANTIYAVQALGLRGFYSCKLAADDTGDFFIQDLTASGVNVNDNAQAARGASGRLHIHSDLFCGRMGYSPMESTAVRTALILLIAACPPAMSISSTAAAPAWWH